MECNFKHLDKEELIHLIQYYRLDSLTGFMMRKDFEADFSELFHKGEEGEEFALVIFDINGLHNINKDFGYTEGDALIRRVSQHIERTCMGDIYRIGGDELAVLTHKLPNVEKISSREACYAFVTFDKIYKTEMDMFNECDKRLQVKKEEFYKENNRRRR